MLASVRNALLEGEGIGMEGLQACDDTVEAAAKLMSKVSSVLRAAKLNNQESGVFHPLSPEAEDSWRSLSRLAKRVRSIDGDEEDTNFLMRARSIEHRLSDAVANEPKLSLANSKVTSLEKVRSSMYLVAPLALTQYVSFYCRVLLRGLKRLQCKMLVFRSWKNCSRNPAPNRRLLRSPVR